MEVILSRENERFTLDEIGTIRKPYEIKEGMVNHSSVRLTNQNGKCIIN